MIEQRMIDAAQEYIRRRFAVLPIPFKSKAPVIDGWPQLRLGDEDLRQHFDGKPMNIGILLGEPSAGLVDVDLDCPEALRVADNFLPATNASFGRPSKPRSHRLYRCEPPPEKTAQFESPDGTMLVELRSTGSQTVFPPSVHESGEEIRFASDGEAAAVDREVLRIKVRQLAAACLLVKVWPQPPAPGESGTRHKCALALAGGLLRLGFDRDATVNFIEAVATAAGDAETADRMRAADSTSNRLESESTATGWPTLAQLLGGAAVSRVKEWLSWPFRSRAGSRPVEPPDLAVLEGLVERAKGSSTALDAPGVIVAMAWLFVKEPAKYDDLKRELRSVDVGTRAFEPRVRKAARQFTGEPPEIDREELEKPSEDRAAKFGPYGCWRSAQGEYVIGGAKTFRVTFGREGEEQYARLANFAARVVEETALDDGADVSRFFTIEGMLYSGAPLPASRVPVSKFHPMNWPTEVWGLGPSVAAGFGTKDHMRAAIEEFSGLDVPRRTVFVHLGWRKIRKNTWAFLHSTGAVGADDLSVDVEAELQKYALPIELVDVVGAVRLSLTILDLGDPRITFPLWAAIWRAPLCEWLPFLLVLWLLGETGTLKSTIAALVLSHFGGPFDKDSLPASWLDTENRLEQKAFLAKDCPIVVDDFCPEKHAGLGFELERRASRLIRAVGNRQARGRLRSDLTARKSYFPRGIVISTAEQIPSLASSALARLLPIPFEKGAIDKARLTVLQAKAHTLPHALRGYLEHLAPQGDELREALQARFKDLRTKARVEGHDRLPEAVAHLYLGLEMGIGFAVQTGALEEDRAKELLKKGWDVFMGLAQEHAKILQEERPTRVFIHSLQEALAGGRAWLAARETGKVASGASALSSEKIGWVDDDGIYLLSTTAYAFASDRLRYRGGVAVGERALREMLLKDGVLIRGNEDRLTTKIRCEGTPTSILWLRRDALGELSDPSIRHTQCHKCGESLSSESAEKCAACGWLVCPSCRSCKADCAGRKP